MNFTSYSTEAHAHVLKATENFYMVMTDPENEKKQINDENLYMVMSR